MHGIVIVLKNVQCAHSVSLSASITSIPTRYHPSVWPALCMKIPYCVSGAPRGIKGDLSEEWDLMLVAPSFWPAKDVLCIMSGF